MRKGVRPIIMIMILAAGLGYAGYFLLAHSGPDSLTVSEIISQEMSLDQQVSMEGKVVPGSISWDDKAKVMRFALTDGKESLSIVYRGIAPDNFKPGTDLQVLGRLRDGIFEANSFKRPSSLCSFCH